MLLQSRDKAGVVRYIVCVCVRELGHRKQTRAILLD